MSNGENKAGRSREIDTNAALRLSVRVERPGAATTSIALPSLTRGSVYEPSLQELRPEKSGVRKLSAVALTGVKHSEALLPIDPALEAKVVRPASFSQIKALQRAPLRFPAANLQPAKLLPASIGASASATAAPENKTTRVKAAAAAGASIPEPPIKAPWRDDSVKSLTGTRSEPLWHALFAPESDLRTAEKQAGGPDAQTTKLRKSSRTHSVFDMATAGDIDVDGLTASRTTRGKVKPPPRKRFVWQTIEGVFLSKTFARALAVVTILLFASTVDVPWRDWANRQAGNIKNPIAGIMEQLSRPIQERAAFQITDEFTNGVDNWMSAQRLNVDPAGWLTMQQGLALNSSTTDLTDYRLDFDAKIQSKAVGWVVRAPNTENYYEFKLFEGGSAAKPEYSLARYSMLDGVKKLVAEGIEAPAHLMKPDDFNRISVRVVGETVTTLINGWGVDHWRDDAIERGGVGLIADAGESALVRKMTVSGNDDTWGLILYGAIESVRSVKELFGARQAPAVILFYRPGGAIPNPSTFLLQGPSAR